MLTFQPYDPVAKENRILGLRRWFSKRDVREGDWISVAVEDQERGLYRVALDRYVLERQKGEGKATTRGRPRRLGGGPAARPAVATDENASASRRTG